MANGRKRCSSLKGGETLLASFIPCVWLCGGDFFDEIAPEVLEGSSTADSFIRGDIFGGDDAAHGSLFAKL